VLAAAAALVQRAELPDPGRHLPAYLTLWIGAAAISVVVVGIETVARSRRVHFGLAQEMIQAAVEQFLPAGLAGAALTAAVTRFAPESVWMLPGLWQIVLSLGVFASCRMLPAPLFAVGVWYLATGLACLAFASGEHAFSPWAMGAPFGIGQFLTAVLIHLIGVPDAED
jgi:hypothetical protein